MYTTLPSLWSLVFPLPPFPPPLPFSNLLQVKKEHNLLRDHTDISLGSLARYFGLLVYALGHNMKDYLVYRAAP